MSGLTQTEAIAVLCDELARLGVAGAAISPGSRSTPVTLALAADERVQTWPIVDERSASFFALGLAKQTRKPSLVVTTSGTAVAELAPAVHEAFEARIPLIALTADRPPELRGIGEGQTIDQVRIFTTAAKYFEPDPSAGEDEHWWRAVAAEIHAAAVGPRPGPVQVNLPLREPLASIPQLPAGSTEAMAEPAPLVPSTQVDPAVLRSLEAAKRPVIIAGRDESFAGTGIASQASRLGIPLLADPLSNALAQDAAIGGWDALLRCGEWARGMLPDLILRSGDMPTSKPLRSWLSECAAEGVDVIQFDPEGAWRDPVAATSTRATGSLESCLASVQECRLHGDWLNCWQDASAKAVSSINGVLDSQPVPTEPAIASDVHRLTPADGILFVAASMPIRDLETLALPRARPPRVLSNRGANGIDGTIATAAAVTISSAQATTLLIGDIAFLHDQSSLILLRDLAPDLTIVVIDNSGGGIFDFLPVRESAGEHFERFFTTPSRVPFEQLARAWEISFHDCRDLTELNELLTIGRTDQPRIIRLAVERSGNRELHGSLWAAVSDSL